MCMCVCVKESAITVAVLSLCVRMSADGSIKQNVNINRAAGFYDEGVHVQMAMIYQIIVVGF